MDDTPQEKDLPATDIEPHARAQRLVRARKMTNLSRRKIEEKYQLKAASLKSWESARYNGLTEKGAERVCAILLQENIYCAVSWLLHGTGTGPYLQQSAITSDDAIQQELTLFLQLHPQATYVYMHDESMAPRFTSHELLAGVTTSNIDEYLGTACIVDTLDKQRLVRIVQAGDQPGTYHLSCLQAGCNASAIDLNNCRVKAITPVIWQRRIYAKH